MWKEIQKRWEIVFYQSEDGSIKLNTIFDDETIWLTQKQMGELFDCTPENINLHLKNIFKEGELKKKWTIKKFLVVQYEGNREVKRDIDHYNLDAIIAVWYRVNSKEATKFRIWATQIIKEFVIKWFVMDDERLKNWVHFGKDYFEELLARIREIRASERRFYQKVTDIYATSVDYDSNADITKEFFAEIQNKFLFAVSNNTAPELVYSRVDSNKENMWLTSWKWAKKWWKIVKTDIGIWKNYLTEEEIDKLNLLVSWYLDFAELQAKNGKLIKMKGWIEKTKNFIELNEMGILDWKWKISREKADQKAEKEYEKFRIEQDKKFISDFDKFAKKIQSKTNNT